MLPSSQARISSEVGSGFRESRSATDIITPGVVNPSWVACSSQNPSWIGERAPSCASPSTVVTCDPSAETASTMQLFTALPSSRTVHAPHSPVSQPTFVPVSPSWSRSVSTRSSLGETSTDTSVPLTLRVLPRQPLSDTGEVVCDLAVAHHEAVVDLPLPGFFGVHRGFENDGVLGLVELVRRTEREVPDHVEVSGEQLLELLAALDVELARKDLSVLGVVVGDQAVDVLVEEVLDVTLVEAKVRSVEIFHCSTSLPQDFGDLVAKCGGRFDRQGSDEGVVVVDERVLTRRLGVGEDFPVVADRVLDDDRERKDEARRDEVGAGVVLRGAVQRIRQVSREVPLPRMGNDRAAPEDALAPVVRPA